MARVEEEGEDGEAIKELGKHKRLKRRLSPRVRAIDVAFDDLYAQLVGKAAGWGDSGSSASALEQVERAVLSKGAPSGDVDFGIESKGKERAQDDDQSVGGGQDVETEMVVDVDTASDELERGAGSLMAHPRTSSEQGRKDKEDNVARNRTTTTGSSKQSALTGTSIAPFSLTSPVPPDGRLAQLPKVLDTNKEDDESGQQGQRHHHQPIARPRAWTLPLRKRLSITDLLIGKTKVIHISRTRPSRNESPVVGHWKGAAQVDLLWEKMIESLDHHHGSSERSRATSSEKGAGFLRRNIRRQKRG